MLFKHTYQKGPEIRQQVKKKKKIVARRIKRKEEQIEANLNEDQRRVASQQRRML